MILKILYYFFIITAKHYCITWLKIDDQYLNRMYKTLYEKVGKNICNTRTMNERKKKKLVLKLLKTG